VGSQAQVDPSVLAQFYQARGPVDPALRAELEAADTQGLKQPMFDPTYGFGPSMVSHGIGPNAVPEVFINDIVTNVGHGFAADVLSSLTGSDTVGSILGVLGPRVARSTVDAATKAEKVAERAARIAKRPEYRARGQQILTDLEGMYKPNDPRYTEAATREIENLAAEYGVEVPDVLHAMESTPRIGTFSKPGDFEWYVKQLEKARKAKAARD